MKRLLVIIFFAGITSALHAQSVASTNFNYWYNPLSEIDFHLFQIRGNNEITIRYVLQSRAGAADKYSIVWEKRESYVQREGAPLDEKDSVLSGITNSQVKRGLIRVALPEKPWLLVAKVTNNETQKTWTYFRQVEKIYPVKGWIEDANGIIADTYLTPKKEYTMRGADDKAMFVSYYNTVFLAANPPFVEKEGKSERFLFHDSTFQLKSGAKFTLKKEGLYLFQQDTTAADGFSYRIMNENFPKFTKIQDLIPPLLLVTTNDEYAALNNANGEKAKFDKVILDITDDKDRAKKFMRSYYRRVELANLYFTSFKEGWKTDRGMIYLIFGVPDEVSKNGGNEIWTYKTANTRFTFVKSGSVYDADNYVLLRDKRFTEPWYATIDQWRKSRFE